MSRFSARQRVILLVLLGAGFMLSVDFSILNVALPQAGAGVGLGPDGLPWITSAFALPAAGFALLFGRLADYFGRRRLFLAGMLLLAGASLLGGFAVNAELLLTARVLQGLATAMALPTSLALLTTTFTDGSVRARVLGLRGALLSAGFAVGALVGGALVSLLGWRAAFFINVPVVVTVLVLTPFVIRESTGAARAKLDIPGGSDCDPWPVGRDLRRDRAEPAYCRCWCPAAGRVLADRAAVVRAARPGAHRAAALGGVGQLRGARGVQHGARDDLPDDAVSAADPWLVPAGDRSACSASRAWRRWPREWLPGGSSGGSATGRF